MEAYEKPHNKSSPDIRAENPHKKSSPDIRAEKPHQKSSPDIHEETVVQIESESVEIDQVRGDGERQSLFARRVQLTQTTLSRVWARYGPVVWQIFALLLWMVYFGYFFYAMMHSRLKDEGSRRLLWVTCVVAIVYFINLILTIDAVREKLNGVGRMLAPHEETISW